MRPVVQTNRLFVASFVDRITERTAQGTMDADKTCAATFGYPVGGIVVPVDKLGLVEPWIGLVGLGGVAALGVVLVRRRKP